MDSLFSHTSNGTDCAHINSWSMLLYPPFKKNFRKIWSVCALSTVLLPSIIEIFHADSKLFKTSVITIWTTYFNNQELRIVSAEYIYVFHIILTCTTAFFYTALNDWPW
jgi:hypothetical protein